MVSNSLSSLSELIETLEDGQKGFESAATEVKDAKVKSVFQQYARQRSQFKGELEDKLRQLGGSAEQFRGATEGSRRGWVALRNPLGVGEKSVMYQAERGENVAVKSYEKAITQSLPAGVQSVLFRQFREVKRAHDRVRNLRDSWQ
jgi:uncharacterized protein (TIGR02284 family)